MKACNDLSGNYQGGDKIAHRGSLGLINFALDSTTLALGLFQPVSAKKKTK